jgi:hypothetical protein
MFVSDLRENILENPDEAAAHLCNEEIQKGKSSLRREMIRGE